MVSLGDIMKVPKDYYENLAYRRHVRKVAKNDKVLRADLKDICRGDFIYFLNAFAWLHETRIRYDDNGGRLPHIIPFITRRHQDEYFTEIRKRLGVENIGVKKCRDEGFSWGADWLAIQDWAFEENIKIGLVSSTEKKSDDPGNMGSLMAKIDFGISRLPKWMIGEEGKQWQRNLSRHSLNHFVQKTSINAFAASPDTGRGDRFYWFLLDEFGSREWQDEQNDRKVLEALFGATDSKLIISTPEGPFGEFFRVMTEPSAMFKIEMNWRDNPIKAKGLYRLINDKPVAVDPLMNPLPANYNPPTKEVIDRISRLRRKWPDLEKETRSPWYDETCDQPEATPEGVAKNINADWGGSVQRPFDDTFLGIVNSTAQPPLLRGNFNVHEDGKYDFGRSAEGEFLLWVKLDANNMPPKGDYLVCADFAQGRGGKESANSALVILDINTREQVAEFAVNNIEPKMFSKICIAACKWFYGAYFAWEHNPPGNVCTDYVIEAAYTHYYCRERREQATGRVTRIPGFWTDGTTRPLLFSDINFEVKDPTGGVVVRSKALAAEFGQYILDKKNQPQHVSEQPGHGDRVMAFGVGVTALKTRPIALKATDPEDAFDPDSGIEPLRGTMAWRMWKVAQANDDNNAYGVDDRSTADFTKGRYDLVGV